MNVLRFQFHYHQANSEKLYDHVPKSILPKDYGGDERSVEELAGMLFYFSIECSN
jgi:hypothetical protein